jgi:hypothetical protein
MKMARITRAPKMPQNSTRCWYRGGTWKYVINSAHTNTLSMLSDFSIR